MKILEKAVTKLGNEITLLGEPGEDNALIIGVFHGDEPQGKWLIEEYIKQYIPLPLPLAPCDKGGKELLFIPCLNPDGMAQSTRTNTNGVDLNRNFPTKNWGENKGENATCDDENSSYYGGKTPASEIETQFVINIIEKYNPTFILTLHTPYKVVNYDGPAKDTAEKISEIINYPVEASIGYPTPGSFGTYCGVERNIPTITLEMDENCPVEELFPPICKIFETLIK